MKSKENKATGAIADIHLIISTQNCIIATDSVLVTLFCLGRNNHVNRFIN
jgi:hypothetical protein